MSNKLTFADMMAIAEEDCAAARSLLNQKTPRFAVNRAYYAMFHAARAALMAKGIQNTRTHSGLIRMFGLHLVKNGLLSDEMGEVLSHAHEIRLLADYQGFHIETADAKKIVEQAENFVATIKALQLDKQSDHSRTRSISIQSPAGLMGELKAGLENLTAPSESQKPQPEQKPQEPGSGPEFR